MSKSVEANLTVSGQVAEHIKALIVSQALKRGAPLPSYRELATALRVAVPTVKRGVDALATEGIVRRQPGQGCFVNKELSPEARALEHIGLIYPSSRGSLLFDKPFLAEIMKGVSAGSPPGGDLHIFSVRDEGLVGAAHLGEWAVDGVILLEVDNDDYLRAFASWGTPGVVVDYCPRDVPLDYVACDNAAASRRVVEHLATLGHRRVAYVDGFAGRTVRDPRNLDRTLLVRDSSDARERREESVHVLQERGMLAEMVYMATGSDDWIIEAVEAIAQWLPRPDRPTALLTGDAGAAADLLNGLARYGIRVPTDFSICAVGGSAEAARRESPRIACCHFDFPGMGRTAVEWLDERCRQTGSAEPRGCRVGFKFVEGQTIGRP